MIRKFYRISLRRRQPETAVFKPLVIQSEPAAIPVQDLHAVAQPVEKHKQIADEWILSNQGLRLLSEPIEGSTHIAIDPRIMLALRLYNPDFCLKDGSWLEATLSENTDYKNFKLQGPGVKLSCG